MDNFDLKKFLTENKLTSLSRLVQNQALTESSNLQENGLNFAMSIAQQAFEQNPNFPQGVDGQNEILRLAKKFGLEKLQNPPNNLSLADATKTLRYQFGYNEDFIDDLIQHYRDLQIEHGIIPGYNI